MSDAAGGSAQDVAPPAAVVVLVEGGSDAAVIRVLAERRRIEPEGRWRVVPAGGATSARRSLRSLARRPDHVLALCDQGESAHVGEALAGWRDRAALFVCTADLEEELLRTAGPAGVLSAFDATGTLRAFRTLQAQPAHRRRPFAAQAHRFIGAGAGRKALIDAELARRLDEDAVPVPLRALLDRLQTVLSSLGDLPTAPG